MRTIAPTHFDSHQGKLLAAIVVALAIVLLVGCNKGEPAPFEAYLDELDVEASLESAEELPLGTYDIASALPPPPSIVAQYEDDEEIEPLWVQIKFQLYAIVSPKDKKAVIAACKRHRGMLDDAIVTICREASKEELDDSRWATLKSRLLDQIRPILGDERIRQLSFADFGWAPI
jgi:flagellar basal body-associated protein FliL